MIVAQDPFKAVSRVDQSNVLGTKPATALNGSRKVACRWCGRQIHQKRRDALYCSDDCRMMSYRATPCTYCGMSAQAQDHVISRRMREVFKNAELAAIVHPPDTVPCCHECNSIAGAKLFLSISQKRRYIKEQLRRRYRKVLDIPTWTQAELDELGYGLRRHVEASIELRDLVKMRLQWPKHPKADRHTLLLNALAERSVGPAD